MNSYYDFYPESLDDNDEEEITIDNWKPSKKNDKLIQSEWRKNKIGNNHNQVPGLDDVHKIKMLIKKKAPDAEIMNFFGIPAETLIAIKANRYCPVEGIDLDNLSKIQKKFELMESALEKLKRGTKFISHILFINQEDLKEYEAYCSNKNKKIKEIIESEIQDETIKDDLC